MTPEEQAAADAATASANADAAAAAQRAAAKTVSQDQYDRTKRDLGDARADAAAARLTAKEAKAQSDAALAAAKTAQDEAAAKIATATETANTRVKTYEPRIIESELKIAAMQAGLNDLDLLALVKRDGVKLGEDGTVTGVAEAIAAFKESKPSYFGAAAVVVPPTASGAPGRPAPVVNPPETNLRELPKAEYEARKKASMLKLAKR
jgi:hypothetical protein